MSIENTLDLIAGKTLETMGYEIVRVHLSGKVRPTLQVIIDKLDGSGISVEDCISVSHTLSAILDVEDPIDSSYQLEVSSPGEDRPLTKLAHYERFKGFPIKMETSLPLNGQRKFIGNIIDVIDQTVTITYVAPDQSIVTQAFDISMITKARLRPEESPKINNVSPNKRKIK